VGGKERKGPAGGGEHNHGVEAAVGLVHAWLQRFERRKRNEKMRQERKKKTNEAGGLAGVAWLSLKMY
jgi:hypothetical protein